mmetsp:Transcript_8805/g.15494  ORF Transcript_8805/g.15494 Transcript_8805/m.15494 type:complete len:119 (+) Transcript_8805:140-496(+)|eukprot:CAMPEP_0184707912 /NCGR_PEP_ID=MMETSP0313-20130426/37511_1 /TAXON_ID=2792 /ORGANISM="Porphyridium aerugineum, Strain SAG 1380-2" /LENGTH=118 /DNA_ID=CAMNT_0027169493 /DNA_START=120 /DNA_END=476 /DNA_ORIENTATION=-
MVDVTVSEIIPALLKSYNQKIPLQLKVIDVFLCSVFMTGMIQFVYCVLVGTFPFNSFLAGFISTIGTFVLTVSLRMQINPTNIKDPKNKWQDLSLARVYADWLFANLILHMAVLNFMG